MNQLYQLFKALLQLTRFWNLVIIGFAQYFAAYFLIGPGTIFEFDLLLLVSSTLMIAAGGYIINDYYDIKIDLINKPERVVIGKSITRRYAIFFHTALSIGGTALGFFVGWRIALINFLSAFLLWIYSNHLKRQPFIGNFVVAILTAISILVVNVHYQPINSLIITYALFAFSMTLVREIIKDMEDWKGDNTFGSQTLPIIWGLRKTKVLLYVLLMLFVATVLVVNNFYLGIPMHYLTILLFLPLGYLIAVLIKADTIRDYARLSSYCKVILILGILSMSLL
ncbi:MAG: geranylgeranylglycerol-phosphate geranylgeranyltransferase [Cyclobacteriaceae bacterium]